MTNTTFFIYTNMTITLIAISFAFVNFAKAAKSLTPNTKPPTETGQSDFSSASLLSG